MTHTDNATQQSTPFSLAIRMVIGACIGLLIISLFIFPTTPDPTWSKFWMIRPLIIVPFAGAMGGLCNYIIFNVAPFSRMNKIIGFALSVVVFLIGLWMGIVLGLDGTLWN